MVSKRHDKLRQYWWSSITSFLIIVWEYNSKVCDSSSVVWLVFFIFIQKRIKFRLVSELDILGRFHIRGCKSLEERVFVQSTHFTVQCWCLVQLMTCFGPGCSICLHRCFIWTFQVWVRCKISISELIYRLIIYFYTSALRTPTAWSRVFRLFTSFSFVVFWLRTQNSQFVVSTIALP